MDSLAIACVFLPLLAALVAGFGQRLLGARGAMTLTTVSVFGAALCAWRLFFAIALTPEAEPLQVTLTSWIDVGGLTANWALYVDTLTAVMLVVVTSVSALVHLYSISYMSHDKSRPRFFAYLSLFTFAMLMLVTADNLVQMFFGWEGVGVASYLLIGFWFEKDSANAASIKAFLVNRVGDFGYALGIFLLFWLTGSVEFQTIFAAVSENAATLFTFWGYEVHALTLACLLLFMGAMGKSAQLGLHMWLPDAMEGPTPVSALIHAATMVTAGVFMLARLSPVFEFAPDAMTVVTVLGALTALVAATIALVQTDIKRVIAYSTMSQLGYMFFALGVSAYGAAVFHLFTHAFFKALLFLGAGSVIHAMSGEQDMRKMGGLWRKIPWTYGAMWIGSLALAGLPFFAGYYSKDMILEAAFASGKTEGLFAFWVGIAVAFLTSFYSWRVLLLTFHGHSRAAPEVEAKVHESGPLILIPLAALTVGALLSGWWGYSHFVGKGMDNFWRSALSVLPHNDSVTAAHYVPQWVILTPIIAAALGIAAAYVAYVFVPLLPRMISRGFKPLTTLFKQKWYFDHIAHYGFVLPAKWLGRGFAASFDRGLIDGLGPNGFAGLTHRMSGVVSRLQSGFIYSYAFMMVIGLVVLLTYSVWVLL